MGNKVLSIGAKASIVYFLANMVNKGIAYITTPIFTNMMTSEEFGVVSVFLTWVSLLGIVAMFCFQAGVFNNGMIEFKDERDSFTLSLLVLSNIISIVCFIPIYLINSRSNIFGMDGSLLFLMGAIFLLQPAYNFWLTRQRFEYKYRESSIIMVLMNILSPLAAILCLHYNLFGNNIYSRLFGAEVVLLLFYAVFYIRTLKKGKFNINLRYWKFALLFNIPLIPHYLSQFIMNSADKIMIANILGASESAYYSVAYSVAAVISIVWTSINTSLVPYTYEKCEKKAFADIVKVVNPLWVIFALVCLILIFFAPEIMLFMAPSEYKIGMYVIPPVVGGVFFQSMYFTFANFNYYYKQTSFVMYASVSSAIINIILNAVLLPQYGFIVAGYTTLLSFIVQASIDYWAMSKVLEKSIFSLRFIILLSSIVIITSCVFPLIYDYQYIRYGIMLVLFILCCIFHKFILAKITDTFHLMKK